MVLLEDLGLEVQILVNGKLAEEFEDRKSDDLGDDVGSQTSMAHRYIESVAGATFSISAGVISKSCPAKDWLDADGENTFKFLLSIDGKAVGSTWVDSDRLTGIVNGVKDLLSNTIQRFQFATISTSMSNRNWRQEYQGLTNFQSRTQRRSLKLSIPSSPRT